jgi:hypothetical protein
MVEPDDRNESDSLSEPRYPIFLAIADLKSAIRYGLSDETLKKLHLGVYILRTNLSVPAPENKSRDDVVRGLSLALGLARRAFGFLDSELQIRLSDEEHSSHLTNLETTLDKINE